MYILFYFTNNFSRKGASLVTQMVKNLPAMGRHGSNPGLGRSLGEGNATPLLYSCLENPMERGARQATAHGLQELDAT